MPSRRPIAKVLVDTCVWIDFFRRIHSPHAAHLAKLVREDLVCVTQIIRAELLSGTRDEVEYRMLEDRLTSVSILSEPADLWNRVALTRFRLARRGFQSAMVDVSIAVLARFHQCPLLSSDRQFSLIAKAFPLRLYPQAKRK